MKREKGDKQKNSEITVTEKIQYKYEHSDSQTNNAIAISIILIALNFGCISKRRHKFCRCTWQ